ncbi:MAG: hypothetical protein JWQ76_5123 [Ramlibacter sp.]|nr:hypothetical protein [Ramlibacter sp.]
MGNDTPTAVLFDTKALLLTRRAVALALVGAWAVYLVLFMPAVSRGDFLLAILRESAAVREHEWLYALTWPLHILGGHIIFYERALQLFNYYALGYSPVFVKYCAIAAWSLAGLGLYRLVQRCELSGVAKLVCLVGLALVTFNPIPWNLLAWPDADVPYLSSLVVLLFSSGAMVRIVNGPHDRAALRQLAALAVLVVIGSGVGWSIVAALLWLFVGNSLLRGHYRHVGLVAAAVAGLLVLAYAVVYLFADTLRLGLVAESLAHMDVPRLLSYFFALQGTLFGLDQRPLNVWAGAGLFTVACVVYAGYKWKHRRASEPELLFIFGVVSLALVSLGRWKLSMGHPDAAVPSYYHIFALPYFYGVLLMLARLLPWRLSPWVLGVAFAGIVASVSQRLVYFDKNFRTQGEAYVQMLNGARGWRMTEALRLIGETFFNQQIFFEFLPDLKRAGKYDTLAADFHPYRSTRIEPPRPSGNGHSCNNEYRNLHPLDFSRDQRFPYTQGQPEMPYYRFVGVARNSYNCDDTHVAVSLVTADGTVACTTWTSPNVYWHYLSQEHANILRSPYAYDFSCPVEGPGDIYLVSREQKTGRIVDTVKVPR